MCSALGHGWELPPFGWYRLVLCHSLEGLNSAAGRVRRTAEFLRTLSPQTVSGALGSSGTIWHSHPRPVPVSGVSSAAAPSQLAAPGQEANTWMGHCTAVA